MAIVASDLAGSEATRVGRCKSCGVKPIPIYGGECLRCKLEREGRS